MELRKPLSPDDRAVAEREKHLRVVANAARARLVLKASKDRATDDHRQTVGRPAKNMAKRT